MACTPTPGSRPAGGRGRARTGALGSSIASPWAQPRHISSVVPSCSTRNVSSPRTTMPPQRSQVRHPQSRSSTAVSRLSCWLPFAGPAGRGAALRRAGLAFHTLLASRIFRWSRPEYFLSGSWWPGGGVDAPSVLMILPPAFALSPARIDLEYRSWVETSGIPEDCDLGKLRALSLGNYGAPADVAGCGRGHVGQSQRSH
jgi:hypothetical protein